MTSFQMTETQEQALDHGRNITVIAGAGSGKTTVLTRRYVRLLEANPRLSARNVLAVTFTERAAAEMMERVRREITDRSAAPDGMRWRTVREELVGAPISTLHGFCARLLRAYPLEAGVDPDFQTLDEPTSTVLLDEAVLEATDPLNGELREELRFLWRGWTAGQLRGTLRSLLADREVSEKRLTAAAKDSPEEMAAAWAAAVAAMQDSRAAMLLEETDLMQLFRHILKAAPFADGEAAELIEAVSGAAARLNSQESPAPVLAELVPFFTTGEGFAPRRSFRGSKQRWRGGDIGAYKSAARAVARILAPHAELLTTRIDAAADRFVAEHLHSLAGVAAAALSSYRRRKEAVGALDFADLQLKALELLRNNPAIGDRCRSRFRYVMVDEFQDTNFLQWRIIKQLVSKGPALARDKLFVVGDPLQSIYAFRLADVEVLEQVRREMDEAAQTEVAVGTARPGTILMQENFRSQPNLIRFNNFLFERLLAAPGVGREPFEPGFEPLRPTRVARSDLGRAEILVSLRHPQLPVFAHEAYRIAGRIRELVEEAPIRVVDPHSGEPRPAKFGDIAVLLRGRTHLGALERALRAAQVPYAVVAGIGFYGQPEILDLISCLTFLAAPWDDVAVAAILRSPLFSGTDEALFRLSLNRARISLWGKIRDLASFDGFAQSDAEALDQMRQLLSRLLDLAARAPAQQLLQYLLEETGAWGTYAAGPRGHQAVANIRKFLDILRELNSSAKPLPDLVRILDLQAQRAVAEPEAPLHLEGENAVKITTIHSAKGLEFPIVILADLGRQTRRPPRPAIVDRELGIGLALPGRTPTAGEEHCSLRAVVDWRARRKELAEEKRLLYVACTRARDHLILSGECTPSQKRRPSGTGWLPQILIHLGLDHLEGGDHVLHLGDNNPAEVLLSVLGPPDELPAPVMKDDVVEAARQSMVSPFAGDRERALISDLAPLPIHAPERDMSVTALAEYRRCPYAYFLGEELSVRDLKEPRSAALARGSFIHRVLQLSHGAAPAELQELGERLVGQASELCGADRAAAVQAALEAVNRANEGRVGELTPRADNVLNEVPVAIRLGQVTLRGVIDRLCVLPERRLAVIDFKTDRIGPKDVDRRAARYRIQLDAYGLSVAKAFSVPLGDVSLLVYFTEPGIHREWALQAGDGEALRREIEQIARAISNGEFPPSHSPETCASCRFARMEVCRKGTEQQ